jgi:hypothetical protein
MVARTQARAEMTPAAKYGLCDVHEIEGIRSLNKSHLRRLVVSLSALSRSASYTEIRLCFAESSAPGANGSTAASWQDRDLVLRKRCNIYEPLLKPNWKRSTYFIRGSFTCRPYLLHLCAIYCIEFKAGDTFWHHRFEEYSIFNRCADRLGIGLRAGAVFKEVWDIGV